MSLIPMTAEAERDLAELIVNFLKITHQIHNNVYPGAALHVNANILTFACE